MILTIRVLNAQDLLVTIEGDSVEVKVETVEEKEISYKYWDHVEGPSYFSKTKNIHRIVYENGRIEEYSRLDEEGFDLSKMASNTLDVFSSLGSLNIKRDKKEQEDSSADSTFQTIYEDSLYTTRKSFIPSFSKKESDIDSLSVKSISTEKKGFLSLGRSKSSEGTPIISDFTEEVQIFTPWYELDNSLPGATALNPGASEVWDQYFEIIGKEWKRVLGDELVENLKMKEFIGTSESDRNLTELNLQEIEFWRKYSAFHEKKRKMYEDAVLEIKDPKRHVYLENETVFNVWYTYKVTKQESETRSSGKIDYDERFDITVYAQNTGNQTVNFAEDNNVVKLDLKHYLELGMGPVAKPKSAGAISIAPGSWISHSRTHTTDPERGYIGHPIVNSFDRPAVYPEEIYNSSWSVEERNAEIDKAKSIDDDIHRQADRAKDQLKTLGLTAQDFAERNQKVKPESTPGTTKIVLYYTSNPLYDDPIMDLSMKTEVFIDGQYITTIKKKERIEINVPQSGDYKLLIQKSKGKEYQFSGKHLSINSGETHYYRIKKVDRQFEQLMFPKPVPQLYNMNPDKAKEELSDENLSGNGAMSAFNF